MDLTGRPLLDTTPDHELFGGRDGELARLADWVERGRNVLLIGERGSGKTTLLRQLAYELRHRHPRTPPAFVEGRLVADARILLELVRRRLGLRPPSESAAWPPSVSGDRQACVEVIDLADLVRGLREAGPRRRRVILVDEPPTDAAQTLFGRLRDDLWQLPFTWAVAASEGDAGVYLTPPTDAFFDDALRLNPLPREAQRRMLEARAGERGRRIALQLDEGNPRRLLALARAALQGGARPVELVEARSVRDEQVAQLGRPAAMLMAELESLGAASAADDRLLRRLGWTRPRAVQVLRELEDQGLVTSSDVKGRAGRPRKVYRPSDLVELAARGPTGGRGEEAGRP
jgi:energy-coupling factor transporter ATP-binding protein EcfA2